MAGSGMMAAPTSNAAIHAVKGMLKAALAISVFVAPGVAYAQDVQQPGFRVMRGAEDPESIPMVTAYERIVRGHLIGDTQRGIEFLSYRVRLNRQSAIELFAYARDGWRQIVAMQLSQAAAICADREQFQGKSELAVRIKADVDSVDALRQSLFDGALELLDEKNRERLRDYVSDFRAEITTNTYDVERSIAESPESLGTMIGNVCAYVDD
jgi:hypothetical protein